MGTVMPLRSTRALAVSKRAAENLGLEMQDVLRLKLQAEDQLCGHPPPFCSGGMETSSQVTFNPRAIGRSLNSQSTFLMREALPRASQYNPIRASLKGSSCTGSSSYVQRIGYSCFQSSC